MTRRPAYPGQEEHLRNIGVIHSGAEGAVKGTRPGSPAVHDADDKLAAEIEQRRLVKAAMKEARQKLRQPNGPPAPKAKRAAFTQAKPLPLVPTLRPAPTEKPQPRPKPEWDNPIAKRSVPKHEQARRTRIRSAQIEAASDPRNPVIRAEIIERDGSRCWICRKVCERKEIHLDHVTPLSRGGKHVPENVKVACKSCNAWKGDRTVTRLLVPRQDAPS